MIKKLIATGLSLAILFSLFSFQASAVTIDRFGETIASANGRVYAIQKDGSLWFWGKGTFNDSAGDQSPERANITKLMDDVIGVYGNWWNGFAIKSDHSMWAFDDLGQAVKVMDDVLEVTNTYTQWIALKTDGTVWRGNLHGVSKPKKIISGVVRISGGIGSFYAVKEDGTLWGWGKNYSGELGVKTKSPDVFTPILIMKDVASVHGAGSDAYAIKKDGSLWGWGDSGGLIFTGKDETWAFDPYKDGSQSVVTSRFTPSKLMNNVLKIDGRNHLAVVKKDGTLWLWGNNSDGQLGDGSQTSRFTPQKALDGVVDVTAEGAYTIALKSDGTLLGFGTNAAGELGLGSFDYDPHPEPIRLMDNIAISGTESSFPSSWVNHVADLEQVEPVRLSMPPFKYYLSPLIDASAAENKIIKMTLKQSSVKTIPIVRNDSAALQASEYVVPNPFQYIKGNLPQGIPTEYKGEMLVQAIKGSHNVILIYGLNFGENRYLVVLDKAMTKIVKAYDFIDYAIAPDYVKADYDYIYQRVRWAAVENGILYVSHSHMTYAKSSKGLNGYITAIRLSDNKMLWRTAPLVSNTRNFQISGDVILSGYGFTAEKDYLYQINKRTGKVLEKITLKDDPDNIDKQKNGFLVYGYSHLTSFLIR